VESVLGAEKLMAVSTSEQQGQQVQFIEHEIECPRCHDSMDLCSDFDTLFYVCQECDFCLYTIKRNKQPRQSQLIDRKPPRAG